MRPILAGYLAVPGHARPSDADREIERWRRLFAVYAHQEGYALGHVFTDVRGRQDNGLYALTEYLHGEHAVAVVVPNLGHLTHTRCLAGADVRTARRYLHAAVLTIEQPTRPST